MSARRLAAIVWLELTQRVRSVAWYVLLGVCALLLVGVTALSFVVWGYLDDSGPGVYSVVVFFALLLVVLVSPTLSGNAINADREAATLAPVQVTLATTTEILIGKFLAAWITGLGFVIVAVPFLLIATLGGGVSPAVVLVSLLILVIEVGIIAAIGVGLSGILARPLFSVAVTYLTVAALVVGTLIAFGLGGGAIQTEIEYRSRYLQEEWPQGHREPPIECLRGVGPDQTHPPECEEYFTPGQPTYTCSEWEVYHGTVPRFDLVWWILAANPFVILADATPTTYDRYGSPADAFGFIKTGVRMAQVAPDALVTYDGCDTSREFDSPTAEEVVASTTPSWFVGLLVQLVLAVGLMLWAGARTRTPARQLPPGTRIA